jgi:putative DNA primase/helicase
MPDEGGGDGSGGPSTGAALDLRLAFYPQTDLGNAERFCERNRGKLLWCPAIGWLFWDGKRWDRDDADEQVKIAEHQTVRGIQNEAAALAKSAFDHVAKTVKGKSGAKELLASDVLAAWGRASEAAARLTPICRRAAPYLCVKPAALDADPLRINCVNGTLAVRRPATDAGGDYISFLPHDPADLITKLAPVNYDPAATCPIYDEFIAYVQPNADIRRFLHQWGGLSLTGDVSEQLMVFFWGKGKNGKSTLLVAWTDVAGDYSRTVPIETFINEGRGRNAGQATPDLAMLAGVRMVQASEPDRGAKLAEALMKLATGGDPMQVRFLNRDYFTLKPCFKLTMSGNYKPRVEGADEGIWRRVRLVPWKITVPEEKRDRHLPAKLRAEASGIFNRMLDGLRDWLDAGLVVGDEVLEATAEYRRDSDPLGQFIDACVQPDAGGRVQSSEFHRVYVAWAEANAASKWSAKGLASALKERGFKSHKSDVSWWLDIKLIKKESDFIDHEGRALRQGVPARSEEPDYEF